MIPKFRAWDGEKMNDDFFIDSSGNCWDYANVVYDTPNLEIFGAPQLKIMQSTGLKDKNGVEIFEGDIIASQNKDRKNWYVSHHEVVWNDAGFKGKQICSSSFIGLDYWTRGADGYVVIGNIYENPELLEKR